MNLHLHFAQFLTDMDEIQHRKSLRTALEQLPSFVKIGRVKATLDLGVNAVLFAFDLFCTRFR